MADPRRVAVLISGRGSNMAALVRHGRASRSYEVVLVAASSPRATGLDWARADGLPTFVLPGKAISREQGEEALTRAFDDHRIGTIALAGYMRLLSPAFVAHWRGQIVNIHPSLLPSYRGLDTHARALADGATVAGCTVHLVTEEVDSGEILARAEVPILPGDDPAALARRVLEAEHRLYGPALADFISRRSLQG